MAATPEGVIKNKIRKLLDSFGDDLYFYMPVPMGFGKATVDYLGCIMGVFFAIEAKKPKGQPTERQRGTLDDIRKAGGNTFVVNDDEGVAALQRFLDFVVRHHS
jgi:hypothetical protein